MKKSWFLLLLIALLAAAVSCNNGVVEADSAKASADGATYLVVRGVDVVYRTLKPDVDTSALTSLVLKGTRTGDAEQTLATVDSLEALKEKTISIQTGTWSFTLTAALGEIGFSGTTDGVEISVGMTTPVSFSLSAVEEWGGLSVTVNFTDSNVTHVVATLRKAENADSTDATTLLDSQTITSADFVSSEEGGMPLYSVTYSRPLTDSEKRLAADSYYLVFNFYAEGTNVPVASPDYIVRVARGFTTTATQRISLSETYTIHYVFDYDWLTGLETLTGQEALPGKYSRKSETITLPELSKANWLFAGWYTTGDFSGNTVTEIPTNSTGDRTFYAKWEKEMEPVDITVTVSESTGNDIAVTHNAETLTDTTLVFTADEGYASYRWTVDGVAQTATGNELTIDARAWATGVYDITLAATDADGNSYSYIAQIDWTRRFIITFNTDNALASDDVTTPETQYVLEGDTATEPEVTPAYGWFTDSAFTKPFDIETAPDSSLTLYGLWHLTTMYVSADGTDGAGRGREESPLATISGAAALMCDSSADYIINVSGTLTGAQTIPASVDGNANSITLTGKNGLNGGVPRDTLDGNQDTEYQYVLCVGTTVPVTVTNLSITNGYTGVRAAVSDGVYADVDITLGEGALVTGNRSGSGVQVTAGTVTLSGGRITNNSASRGAGVLVTGGEFVMTGGEISGNTAGSDVRGSGVYVGSNTDVNPATTGIFKMGGEAIIAEGNDVYLEDDCVITLCELFEGSIETAATITPATYEERVVLEEEGSGTVEYDYGVFKVTPTSTNGWQITEEGKLQMLADIDGAVSQIEAMTENGTVTLTGYMTSEDLVTIVGAMKEKCPSYTSNPDVLITLDLSGTTGLTELDGEFADIWNIGELVLPEGITAINGIGRADSMTRVNIPASVTEIGEIAFYRNSANLTIASGNETYTITNNALYTKDLKTLVAYANKADEDGACEVLASATEIAPRAFSNARKLKTLTFAENSQLTTIGEEAFDYCTSLEAVVLPESVTELGNSVFQYAQVTSIVLPSGITEIPACTFSNNAFTSIVIPEGVKSIGAEAFWCCRSLTTVTIPATVTEIGMCAFGGCTSLTTVCYPEGNDKTGIEINEEESVGESNDGFICLTWTFGNKSAPDAVCDIVFTDGSAIAYSESLSLSDSQKAAAFGVVYNADTANGIPKGILGKIHTTSATSDERCHWANTAQSYPETISATSSVTKLDDAVLTGESATIGGDNDGSDNWSIICAADTDGTADADAIATNYPAFAYVEAYAATNGLTETENYADGWYMPSLAEMVYIIKNRETFASALTKIGGTSFADQEYWTSTVSGGSSSTVWYVGIPNDGPIGTYTCNDWDNNVICVHQF